MPGRQKLIWGGQGRSYWAQTRGGYFKSPKGVMGSNGSEEVYPHFSLHITPQQDDAFLHCLAELSNFIVQNTDQDTTILLRMDSNCSEKSTSRRFKGLQEFCSDHNLIQISQSQPTFHHSNSMSESNIDYFLISRSSRSTLGNVVSQCKYEYHENFSSHDPVFSDLSLLCQPIDRNEQ